MAGPGEFRSAWATVGALCAALACNGKSIDDSFPTHAHAGAASAQSGATAQGGDPWSEQPSVGRKAARLPVQAVRPAPALVRQTAGRRKGGGAQAGDAQAGDAQGGTSQAGYAQGGTAQAGYAQAGTAQAGDAQGGTSQAGHAQGGTAQAGHAGGTAGTSGAAGCAHAGNGGSCTPVELPETLGQPCQSYLDCTDRAACDVNTRVCVLPCKFQIPPPPNVPTKRCDDLQYCIMQAIDRPGGCYDDCNVFGCESGFKCSTLADHPACLPLGTAALGEPCTASTMSTGCRDWGRPLPRHLPAVIGVSPRPAASASCAAPRE